MLKWMFVASICVPILGNAASFDCKKASTSVEKMICSDAALGRLDEALGENYKMMMATNIGEGARADLKSTQRQWVAQRNKCADAACVLAAYKKRVDEVCDYPAISGMHPTCKEADDIIAK